MDRIRLHPEADDDYNLALVYYYNRSPQAAVRFEAEVDRVLKIICRDPLRFPKYDELHRFATLRKFPISIVFQTAPDEIHVVAVAHGSREDGYWLGRA